MASPLTLGPLCLGRATRGARRARERGSRATSAVRRPAAS